MASRRNLKKTIHFISSELILDAYFRCLLNPNVDESKVDQLVIEIADNDREFVLRAGKPAGKNNPKLVKEYYRKLYADWQNVTEKTIKALEEL